MEVCYIPYTMPSFFVFELSFYFILFLFYFFIWWRICVSYVWWAWLVELIMCMLGTNHTDAMIQECQQLCSNELLAANGRTGWCLQLPTLATKQLLRDWTWDFRFSHMLFLWTLLLLFVVFAFLFFFFITDPFWLEAFLKGWTVGSSINIGDICTEGNSDTWK